MCSNYTVSKEEAVRDGVISKIGCNPVKDTLMKKYFVLLALMLPSTALCQFPGQVLVSSYNDTVDIVRFCDGTRQNSISVGFGAVNLLSTTDPSLTIDSITFIFRAAAFDTSGLSSGAPFELSGAFGGFGPNYSPQKPGDDTMIVRFYYGPYHSDGTLIYHSKDSPLLGLLGIENTNINLVGGYEIGNDQQELVTDTIHDVMNGLWYPVSSTPQSTGFNTVITLKACGDVVVDSINQVGEFSEFNFYKLPTLPLQMHQGDSLIVPYIFIPHIPDRSGRAKHYLVFHATNGTYLTWSFEYKVIDTTSSVSSIRIPTSTLLSEYPNPNRGDFANFIISDHLSGNSSFTIVNALGKELSRVELHPSEVSSGTTIRISTADFPNGIYLASLYTPAHVSSIRFAVIH